MEDKIIQKLIEHEAEHRDIRENMMNKDDGRRMMDLLEGVASMVKDRHEEQSFRAAWLNRLQEASDRHERDIRFMREHLKLA
ncbi:hypothetical protein A2856_01215 [Candidatus Uhrbacteria bacterium RIFCSPHIGHO2_01_FULL_63_20]|uniref:Uncharacterized protein n=1 Tax=Candidatus Uhrbacteria bacterium RIFCSPHIGHO2_01_FULL_63_20 TaxID=1802385 RepID=A0A1F7TMU4_9BACT|nr:MAG: hypothetical protein A2856_01215 [Candidatus Uhrbacteria bacterium RIFCSPHIGHO2_01_FULL_63_20]